MKTRRYQLRKDAVAIIQRGHPWIFREQLSSAAGVFGDGDWLRLVDGTNTVVGHGIYEAEGAIAIRMLRVGPDKPDAAYLRSQLAVALRRRTPLAARTDGIRLLHGESDGIPAVVVDRFGDTLVVASYSSGADALARYVAGVLASGAATLARADTEPTAGTSAAPSSAGGSPAPGSPLPVSDSPTIPIATATSAADRAARIAAIVGPARHVVLRPARRRRGLPLPPRVLRGSPPDVVTITEDGQTYAIDLAGGQKTGTYLDLRGLRAAIAQLPLAGKTVLNTFAYTGMLGRAAEAAGASAITHVDSSEKALAFAREHHVTDPAKHHFITADIFQWLPNHDGRYDVVIIDPPAMTSRKAQVPGVLAAYRKLYRAAARLVNPGGLVIAACCTSRIERAVFHKTVRAALGETFTRELELPAEVDHPVGFPQADYLKIALWRAQ
ncbi:MAG: class I SAM-dependent rRNA methyltransferase [Deltaproteobacteria bacterium]|nr:class I SAM-dependent rRNA methyltransferase [Deltaproteobacteria bacterium]